LDLPPPTSTSRKTDLICLAALVVFTVLFWCFIYNRWTPAQWDVPITYREDVHKGDVLAVLAAVKGAEMGNVPPMLFKHVPELGAPFGANWNDFPNTEEALFWIEGVFAKVVGIFASLNLVVLLAHILAGLSCYVACRMLQCSWEWSLAAGFAFGFSRYIFAHAAHHVIIAYYWHIPLCLVVCRWVLSEEVLDWKSWKFRFALIVAFITGMQNVYYTNMFAQLVLFGGIVQWTRKGWKGWRAGLPAAAIIGCAAFAFFLMNADTFAFKFIHGPNTAAVERPYKWLELAALKLTDMFVPPPDHSFAPFAEWGTAHQAAIVIPPGEWPPTGYLGLVAIAALGWLAVSAFQRGVKNPCAGLPMEAWMIGWILLYAGVGGLNGMAGTLGFCLFRGTTRYSIFILAILLIYLARRMSEIRFKDPSTSYIVAGCAALLALYDQSPTRFSDRQIQVVATDVDNDRKFAQEMEKRLPKGGMIFQIPIMDFPENPVPGVPSYHHFRPYLFSESLRYSFGDTKGRPQDAWQKQIGQLDVLQAVERLESYGFAGVFINKEGFADKGETLIKSFAAAGRAEVITSPAGDLCCIVLNPSPNPVLPTVAKK